MLESHRGRTRAAASLAVAAVALGGSVGAVGFAGTAYAAGEPTIKSLSTAKGSTAGGTNVLITGTGFTGVSETVGDGKVTFGGVNATSIIVISDTQIAAKAPAGTGSNLQVKVTNANGDSADTTADNFTYIAPVTVTVPASTKLSAAGGTVFTATVSSGTVSSAADVTSKKLTATVNGATAKIAYGGSADTVTITAPVGTPTATGGTVSVSVLSDGVVGTADTTNAKYVAVITKLTVVSGPVAGTNGTSDKPAITITGVGLKTATAWQFGGVAATCNAGTGTKEDTTVTCEDVPAASVAGPVTVNFTLPSGATQGVTAGSTYTYADV